MIKPDQKVMQALSGMDGSQWNTIVDWFQRSYADAANRHVGDTDSDDRKYRIQQGMALQLRMICKYLKEAEQSLAEARRNDDRRSQRPIQLETI